MTRNEKIEINGCDSFVFDDDKKLDTTIVYRMGYDEKKGRGLYATQIIPPHTVIHIAPCIRIDQMEYNHFMKYTILETYLFNDIRTGHKLLALGYGSIFNHSNYPNVNYLIDSHNVRIIYKSGYKTIEKDEELCITYGSNLWFDNADDDNTEARNPSSKAVVEESSNVNENGDEENFLKQIEIIDDDNR